MEYGVSEAQRGAVVLSTLRTQRQDGQKQDGAGVFQTTLRNRIGCAGIGLHTGKQVRFTVYPAEAGSGITFRRIDLAGTDGLRDADICIQACFKNISSTQLGSTLTNQAGISVATVEHLMAAFYGCGIDNARVDLDGPELPVLDGSASPFVMLLECAGITRLPVRRRYLRVRETVRVEEEGKWASLSPYDGSAFAFEIQFPAAIIGRQSFSFELSDGNFKTEIAPARTFGFLHEVEHLKSLGLALGGSLTNAIVLDGESILNDGGLRFSDEFVRHKILDAIGDLYQAGAPVLGRFEASRAGHGLNNKLLRALFNTPQAWEYVEAPQGVSYPSPAAAPARLRRAARG